MVARAAIRHCRQMGDDVFAPTRSDLDIDKWEHVEKEMRRFRPEAVINSAAYTDVDGAESNPDAAIAANVDGVENLAFSCRDHDAVFVTISTDYVFDGGFDGFYTQRHTPNPQGVYARSKYQGELKARKANARSIIVRSGWIYGEGGKNFLSVMRNMLAEKKPIKAIDDSFGTPTFAGGPCCRLRRLAELDLPCIFHATNSGPGTSYLGFAEKICEIGGFDKSLVEAVSSEDLPRPAPRPASSKLACLFSEKFGLHPIADWELALRRFMEK